MIEWFREHFKQPLGLLGLLAIILIIIIYLIKARYVERPVSSTFIWQRSLKYIKRKIPMSVIMSLLLIIQILTVITASLAISRPLIKPLKTNETILILDASASMQTEDQDGKTRFDLGIDKILEYAESAGTNSKVSLILASNKPTPVFERLDSEVDIIYAVEDLKCTNYEVDSEAIEVALKYANDIKKTNVGATIKFITDKDYAHVENLEIVNVSRQTDKNISILSASDRLMPNKNYEFNANLTSYGFDGFGSECTISLTVTELITGSGGVVTEQKHVYVKIIQVPNHTNGTLQVTFTPSKRTSDDPNKIYVEIDPIKDYSDAQISIEARDGLKIDNSATVFKTTQAKPTILMVSKFFSTTSEGKIDTSKPTTLQAALSANGYVVRSENMYKEVTDDIDFSGFDLYIFEGVDLPQGDRFPSDGSVWILNPKSFPEELGLTLGQEVIDNTDEKMGFDMYLTSSGSNSTSLTYQTISNKLDTIAKLGSYTEIIQTGSNLEKIFSCGANDPALLAGIHTSTEGSVRLIVTSFDFRNSNWAYLVTDYIILVNNLVKYSIPTAIEASEDGYQVGDTIEFNAPAGASKVSLYYDGTLIDSQANIISMKAELNEIGTYEFVVEYADGKKQAQSYKVASSISKEESDVTLFGDAIVAPAILDGAEVEADPIEIFPYLIAFLLLLLVVEWGVYHRDGF